MTKAKTFHLSRGLVTPSERLVRVRLPAGVGEELEDLEVEEDIQPLVTVDDESRKLCARAWRVYDRARRERSASSTAAADVADIEWRMKWTTLDQAELEDWLDRVVLVGERKSATRANRQTDRLSVSAQASSLEGGAAGGPPPPAKPATPPSGLDATGPSLGGATTAEGAPPSPPRHSFPSATASDWERYRTGAVLQKPTGERPRGSVSRRVDPGEEGQAGGGRASVGQPGEKHSASPASPATFKPRPEVWMRRTLASSFARASPAAAAPARAATSVETSVHQGAGVPRAADSTPSTAVAKGEVMAAEKGDGLTLRLRTILEEHEKNPSPTVIAARLGKTRASVDTALNELRKRGFLEAAKRANATKPAKAEEPRAAARAARAPRGGAAPAEDPLLEQLRKRRLELAADYAAKLSGIDTAIRALGGEV